MIVRAETLAMAETDMDKRMNPSDSAGKPRHPTVPSPDCDLNSYSPKTPRCRSEQPSPLWPECLRSLPVQLHYRCAAC
jgi:hypothetical protein